MKPDKIIYENQDDVHDKIISFIKVNLTNDVKEAYMFGKYTERYGEHDGSDIDVMILIQNNKVPKNWKYLNTEKEWWKLYRLGKMAINGTTHNLDAIVVKDGMEKYSLDRVKKLGWSIEKIK
jgi:predicted nucleotidyltransferase